MSQHQPKHSQSAKSLPQTTIGGFPPKKDPSEVEMVKLLREHLDPDLQKLIPEIPQNFKTGEEPTTQCLEFWTKMTNVINSHVSFTDAMLKYTVAMHELNYNMNQVTAAIHRLAVAKESKSTPEKIRQSLLRSMQKIIAEKKKEFRECDAMLKKLNKTRQDLMSGEQAMPRQEFNFARNPSLTSITSAESHSEKQTASRSLVVPQLSKVSQQAQNREIQQLEKEISSLKDQLVQLDSQLIGEKKLRLREQNINKALQNLLANDQRMLQQGQDLSAKMMEYFGQRPTVKLGGT